MLTLIPCLFHTYTLDPTKSEWADYAAVKAWCGNLSEKELPRKSSGNTRLQSSQLTEPLWAEPGLGSGVGARELISTWKKTEERQRRRVVDGRALCQGLRACGEGHLADSEIYPCVLFTVTLNQTCTCKLVSVDAHIDLIRAENLFENTFVSHE